MANIQALCWLRYDLRLADNPALTAAIKAGSTVAVYILDESTPRPLGGASRWWLHYSLQELQKTCAARNIPLILKRGDPSILIPALMKQSGAAELHASRSVDPYLRELDKKLAQQFDFTLHDGALLHDPDQVKTKTGGFYKVYTPFSRTVMALDIPRPLPAPKQKSTPSIRIKSDTLSSWKLLPTRPDWAGGLRAFWKPGEKQAIKQLRRLNDKTVSTYATGRNLPGEDQTSRLSAHLAFGEISPRQIWHSVHHHADAKKAGLDHNRLTYLKEIVWRDFAAHTLYHQPHLIDKPLDKRFTKFPWLKSDKNLKAWQRGQTGYPIVDAGMRQLWQTGWMHNRVRMIVASFSIKHLMLKWQAGEAWFWDTLVDADLASNTFNWQWVAGSGADAAPFFRIFNPIVQGKKFDARGAYVRKYVPELKNLPDKHIHAPWTAPADILKKANVELGKNYPQPIVDHEAARARTLAAFRSIRNR